MPGYKGHIVGGIGIFLLLSYFLVPSEISIITKIECLLFALAGSLFPDIDINSKGQRLFYSLFMLILAVCLKFGRWFACGVMSLILCVPIIAKHRSIFHRWWFLTLIFVFAGFFLRTYAPTYWQISNWNLYFFAAGAYSHLLLDRFL